MTHPSRKSNEELKRTGGYRPDRHGSWDMPIKRPRKPNKMHVESKKVWEKVCDVMEAAGTISVLDELALTLLCDTMVIYKKAHDQVMDDGFLIQSTTRHGTMTKTHPATQIRDNAQTQILRILKEFGMTPAARGQKPSTEKGGEAATSILGLLNPK